MSIGNGSSIFSFSSNNDKILPNTTVSSTSASSSQLSMFSNQPNFFKHSSVYIRGGKRRTRRMRRKTNQKKYVSLRRSSRKHG